VRFRARNPWTTEYPWFELWERGGQTRAPAVAVHGEPRQAGARGPAARSRAVSIFYVADDIRLRVLSIPYEVPGARTVDDSHDAHPRAAADALDDLRWIIFISRLVIALW